MTNDSQDKNTISTVPVYHRDLSETIDGKYHVVYDMLIPGSRILEIGCSSGYFGEFLVRRGFDVVGVEYDESAAELARAKGLLVVSGNIQQADVVAQVDGSFDAILIMDVLEHLTDPGRALDLLLPRLRQGGRLIVSGPNVAYWNVRIQLALGRWNYQESGIMDETHMKFYTIDTWKKLLNKTELKFVRSIAAEAMLPKEHFYKNFIPKYNIIKNYIKNKWPRMFAIVVVFEYVRR